VPEGRVLDVLDAGTVVVVVARELGGGPVVDVDVMATTSTGRALT
jgi:hypothetical protein